MKEETGAVQGEFFERDLSADGVDPAHRQIEVAEGQERIRPGTASLLRVAQVGRNAARVREFVVGVGHGHLLQHQADLGEVGNDGSADPLYLQTAVHIVGRDVTDEARQGTRL